MSKQNIAFRPDILSNVGTLMNLTKNQVLTKRNLWTRYLLKKRMQAFVLT